FRSLIRINANEAGLHLLIEPENIVGLPRRSRSAERSPDFRQREAEEVRAPGELHLDEQRLTFMQRHAAGEADRLRSPAFGQPLLIKRMAGLVQRAHQALRKVIALVAGGKADVIGNAAGKGMMADVKPAVLEIKTERRHECEAKILLHQEIEGPFGTEHGRSRFLALERRLQEIRQKAFKL